MVAAVPLTTVSQTNQKTVTSNDLRNIALGLAAAITLILVAGQIFDSGSASVSDLEEEHDKRFITIDSGQSANIAENSATDAAVLTVAITDGPATGCAIASGNTDVDGDGNYPFQISTTCVITVDDGGDLDYEDSTNSFTLTLLASNAGGSDVETVAISVTDVNDQTPTYSSSDTTPNVDEGDTAVETVAITDTDTGDSNTCTKEVLMQLSSLAQ